MSFKDELQKFMNEMAMYYSAGDAAACARMFTLNGELFSPYSPTAHCRDEIEELHRVWTDGVSNKKLTVVDAGGSGDLAWCLAIFSEGEVTVEGTSFCVFERQPDGSWLIRICSLNGVDTKI
jgi:ketosteroid isomerase-like protein